MSWTIDDARALYSVERWSEGLFDIGEDGHVHAHPLGPGSDGVKLDDIVDRAAQMGYPLPILIRFKDILRRRVDAMLGAFDHAIQASGYRGGYTAIYPIKVNQRASVLTSVLDAGQRVGLEAGSKPELLAVLAMSRPGGVIICNGYKDEEYIRMALIGRELGLRVYIVVEKLAEVPAIIRISQQLGIAPALGVRLRLASIGYGKWQNTGGDKAKFGLSAGQLLEALDLLRAAGMDECLELLHFHMGSQISNLADIQLGVAEAGRYFQ
ncbi:MAG: arginine decarboxylase, partial [Pseudomonadota bacterium]